MNTKNKVVVTILAILLCSFAPKVSQAQSVALSVEFGVYLSGGGDCVNKGVCDCDVFSGSGTKVLFNVSADGNTLIMTFNLSDLKNNQPGQVAYFTSGSYVFDGTYSLSSPLFAELNLPSGAQITPNSNGTVSIDGDLVTVYETISTSN